MGWILRFSNHIFCLEHSLCVATLKEPERIVVLDAFSNLQTGPAHCACHRAKLGPRRVLYWAGGQARRTGHRAALGPRHTWHCTEGMASRASSRAAMLVSRTAGCKNVLV
ncbi:hypothetical protein HAX54_041236 [Datura stramonium]|uniref:Uncharacterized protein n=1 Tax=Datura stramonium TaxID=4076 RepID=A0ABS8VP99_DATST|nr:hypothetical protein [Datura stramonium]